MHGFNYLENSIYTNLLLRDKKGQFFLFVLEAHMVMEIHFHVSSWRQNKLAAREDINIWTAT